MIIINKIEKYKLLQNEIYESVYQTKTDNRLDVSKTLSFKYDSQLVSNNLENSQVNKWSIETVSNFIKSVPGCFNLACLFELEVFSF